MESHFLLDVNPLKPTKDLARGALLVSLDRHQRYRVSTQRMSWLDASPTIRALNDGERELVRLFVEPQRAPSKEKALRIRGTLLDALYAREADPK